MLTMSANAELVKCRIWGAQISFSCFNKHSEVYRNLRFSYSVCEIVSVCCFCRRHYIVFTWWWR